MTDEVTDFFRIDDLEGSAREPVATLVGSELQDGATEEFIELWRRRPREVNGHWGRALPGGGCALHLYAATLEDHPLSYIVELSSWLFEHVNRQELCTSKWRDRQEL